MTRGFIFIFSAMLWLAPAASRAQIIDAAKVVAGAFEVSNADRDKTCMVTLKAEGTATAMKVELDKACAVPPMKDVTAWVLMPDDAVRLLDARGRIVFDFSEVESGMYEGTRPGEGLYFMQNAAGVVQNVIKTAKDMFGDWAVAREGASAICTLTLANKAVTNGYAVVVKPGCSQTVTGFGPVVWQMEQGELVIKSARGESWRFEEFEPSTWRRVSEATDPLMLTKP